MTAGAVDSPSQEHSYLDTAASSSRSSSFCRGLRAIASPGPTSHASGNAVSGNHRSPCFSSERLAPSGARERRSGIRWPCSIRFFAAAKALAAKTRPRAEKHAVRALPTSHRTNKPLQNKSSDTSQTAHRMRKARSRAHQAHKRAMLGFIGNSVNPGATLMQPAVSFLERVVVHQSHVS